MAHQLKTTQVLEGYGVGLICQLQAGHFCYHPTRIEIQLQQDKIPQSTQNVCSSVLECLQSSHQMTN